MVHWAWLPVALFVGVSLGIFIGLFAGHLLTVIRTPPSPFSDRSIAKMEKMEEKNLG